MNIFKEVENALRAEHGSGKTHQEIASRAGIKSPSYISKLLSDKSRIKGITLETFVKFFPNATVNLSGNTDMTLTPAPTEPFLKIVQDNWLQLSIEDRGRIATEVAALVADKSKKTKTAG